uniref:Helitron helicase-like domain-containing protein n=1 Tax=Panagrolaimus sp. JU765 TaxID=591449 RepID=A0AC34QDY1_9BILA
MVVLPATFTGSPRYMEQNYQDAMTMVRKYGKPDLFITMTCNPNWPEIKENLKPGQEVTDRPDIAVRVFKQKVDELVHLLNKGKIFGKVRAYVYTIEFQKRGLPHVHLLLTLESDHKLRNSDSVDAFISAEIPDKNEFPVLYEKAVKHMLHGPCGPRCEKEGKCSKKFPKKYLEKTDINVDGYPNYKRSNNGVTVEKSGHTFDNRHVVPYNPVLLMIMDCHINVEVVASIKSIKYAFKYIFKGHDRAAIKIDDQNLILDYDECNSFSDNRYIGVYEACWRLLEFPIHGRSHSILRLPIHLPNADCNLEIDANDENALDEAQKRKQMLNVRIKK